MQISNEYSFIHYAIPKTASQSSWRTFSKYVDVFGIDDCNSLIYHHAIPSEDLPEYKTYFKFCFVRNPWDRLVSHYFYNRSTYGESFEDFVINFKAEYFLQPQHKWYSGVDYIARYEKYNEELQNIFSIVGISDKPVIWNINSTVHNDYKKYYTDKLALVVYEKYKKDINELGYEFDD